MGGWAFILPFANLFYISLGLISRRTKASETGTVLALYTVILSGLVNMLAASLAGPFFDVKGARPLYAFAMIGYALSAIMLGLARPREQHVEILQPVSSQNPTKIKRLPYRSLLIG